MKFELKEIRTDLDGFEQLAELYAATSDLMFDKVVLDLFKCQWFDANMVAPLAAVLSRITDDLNDVEIRDPQPGVERILRKNRFLTHYGFEPVDDPHGTVVPYTRFQLTDDRYFLEYVARHTAGKGLPAMSPELLKRFHGSLGELFANAAMHSHSRMGVFAAGQYFPTRHRFDFCVADAGEGFVGSILRAFHQEVDSVKAMRFCLKEGNTTKTSGEPGGLGLKLLKAFIERNQGRIVIVSNAAYYEFSGGRDTYARMSKPFPGTCIDIQIDTADFKSYRLGSATPTPL
jgi:hypothetical protein